MAASDIAWSKPASIRAAERDRIASILLVALLICFTLTTMDAGDTAARLLSGVLLLAGAVYLCLPPVGELVAPVPVWCVAGTAVYALVQTLLLRGKPVYEAWDGVLFWVACFAITFLASQIFREPRRASLFRRIFVVFGSALCVLELVEQGARTNRYRAGSQAGPSDAVSASLASPRPSKRTAR
jgi:hypothetical protein